MKEIKLGDHLLYNGDCCSLDISVVPSLLLTDPPYGINKKGIHGDSTSNYNKIVEDICSMFDKCSDGASGFVFGIQPNLSKLIQRIDDRYSFVQNLIWIKMQERPNNKFMTRHEEIVYFCKDNRSRLYKNELVHWYKYKYMMSDFSINKRSKKSSSLRVEKEYLRACDIFKYNSINKGSFNKQEPFAGAHPTMKPVKLLEDLILQTTNEGDWIFDPYAGSGSVLIACENTNRRCISVEIEERYCDIIVKRFNQHINERNKIV